MKEFMLLIRNEKESKTNFSPGLHLEFVKACEVYIEAMIKNGNLIGAQPLVRDGKMISGTPGAFNEGSYTETNEIIVGYYHILANDIDEAVELAKGNPEFAYTQTAKIEVRPIKMKEETTSFVYPQGK